jgi:hypothetical protein
LTWTLLHHGWASCVVADNHSQAEMFASYVTDAPEDLLDAIRHITLGDDQAHADLEGEPTIYRWQFNRHATDVDILITSYPSRRHSEAAAALLWTSRQPVHTVARAVIRAFDAVATEYGHDEYRASWGRPVPDLELAGLRAAWRSHGK